MKREPGGTLYEGMPPVATVPTGLPMTDGIVLAVLVPGPYGGPYWHPSVGCIPL
ncbi:hypothetical protein [Streptomyces chrestomyceticus]|uniref:hypothetical protein n=1 Tax=Streptomyces chrestomyceticus TaxID=68185 RepID=UPI0033F2535A